MALASIQDSLKNAVKLAFPKADYVTCVYTDASEERWAAVVTQAKEEQLGKPIEKQQHEPMAFLGGRFTGAQKNWTTYEKEAYAIVQTFDRMDFLLWGAKQIHVFTDHKNLLYVLAPLALRPSSPRHVLSKVHRWAIHLSRFEFSTNHIEGPSNVFADILARWSKGYRTTNARSNVVAALYTDIVPTSTGKPPLSSEDIKKEQEKYTPPENAARDGKGLYDMNGRIWIPNEATNLKLRIAVEAHCGNRGHRGFAATMDTIFGTYWWAEIRQDIREFTQYCIHCIVSRHGDRIPRPMATVLHREKPNEVVHTDFLYMGPAEGSDLRYTLLIKDDVSSYSWLVPCATADSDEAASALSKWIASFGSIEWLVTEQGSHFTAALMKSLTSEHHINHHFTTPYCPWANGTIERLCREVLRVLRALLSELMMSPKQWPAIMEAVQKIINQSPVQRLGRDSKGRLRSPMQIFSGLKPSPLLIRPMPLKLYRDMKGITEARLKTIVNIESVHEALGQVHKEISECNDAKRKHAQRVHNARTNVLPLSIYLGDYVMVRSHEKCKRKLQAKWKGPMKVTAVKSNWVFEVQDINDGRTHTVHAQRIIKNPVSLRGKRASEELRQQAAHYDTIYFLVDAIKGVRKRQGTYEVKVSWLGFESGEDDTWEPLNNVQNDMPGILEDFLHTAGDRNVKREILDLLF